MNSVLLLAVVLLAFWVWIERSRNRRDRLSGAAVQPRADTQTIQAFDLSDRRGDTDFHIVGESRYQPELRRVAKSGRLFTAVLMPEPTNPYDRNAICVTAEAGKTVGYLDRAWAVEYQEVFALLARHGRVGACRAKLIGGVGNKKSYGVLLNLRDRESLLVDIRDALAPGTPVSDHVQPF
jgi:hypothetical protein